MIGYRTYCKRPGCPGFVLDTPFRIRGYRYCSALCASYHSLVESYQHRLGLTRLDDRAAEAIRYELDLLFSMEDTLNKLALSRGSKRSVQSAILIEDFDEFARLVGQADGSAA